MDQLRRDSHLVARPDYLPLEESVDAQFTGNLSSRLASSEVAHCRSVRDDEMTRREPIWARLVISSSVMPSAKNCWSGSFERFNRGRTAIEFKRKKNYEQDRENPSFLKK